MPTAREFELKCSNEKHNSVMTTIPKDISIVVYNSARDIIEAFEGCKIEDIDCSGFVDGHGEAFEFGPKEYLENVQRFGAWGFCDQKNKIHVWFDESTTIEDRIRLFSHEVGHMQRPYHRDFIKEEMKAEMFSDVATISYSLANISLNLKAEGR